MKNIITTAALLLSLSTTFGQESYTIKMNMKIEGLPPEYAGFGEQEFVNYNKGDMYKSEMTSMMGSSVNSFDGKMLTSVSDQMGNKSGYTATKEEIEAAAKEDKNQNKPKIEYTTDKKTIAGYECTKAIVTTVGPDKKESKINVWATDKIKVSEGMAKSGSRRASGMDFGDLKGYPLAIEMSQNQGGMEMKVNIAATEVSTAAIDDAIFKISTEGYKMISYKEYNDRMKAQMKAAAAGK